MKRWLPIVGGVVVLGLLVVAVLLFALPRDYEVTREIVVDAPIEVVFDQVNDLEKSEAWSPWIAADPTVVQTYGDVTVGPGASYAWAGDVGSGSLRIVSTDPPHRIDNLLHSPDMGETAEAWEFTEEPGGVRVAWTFSGAAPGASGPVLAMAMDSLVGPYFEDGLARLKAAAESAGAKAGVEALHWLLGCWHQQGDDRRIEECWEVGDGVLHGTSVDFRFGKLHFQESLRIEVSDGQVRYVATPMDQATTAFALTASEPGSARFENPEHDFPTVIAYRRDGDTLTATISDGSHERSWTYTRVP